MAAIGREGGESRSAAARQARQRVSTEREVPMSISRDGLDSVRTDIRPIERARPNVHRADDRTDGASSTR